MTNRKTGGRAPKAHTAAPERPRIGLIVLGEMIDQFLDMRVEDATSNLSGLADLIEHHPGFQREVKAIRAMSEARDVLVRTSNEAKMDN
jgi:hypothetical protein